MNALFDKKNEDALEVLAELLDPVQNIITNEAIKKFREDNKEYTYIDLVKIMIQNCKNDVMAILAITDGVEIKDANYSAMDILRKLLELFSNDEFKSFFV